MSQFYDLGGSVTDKYKKSVDMHVSLSIDAVRGMAALGVIYGHSFYRTGLPIELNGAFWVWIFLIISGFLVARGFFHGGYASFKGAVRFLRNRFLRVVPLAWLALALGLASHLLHGEEVSAAAMLQFAFLSPLNDMFLVGPLWTVAVEIKFYLFGSVVLWILSGRHPSRTSVWLGCVMGLLVCLWATPWFISWLGDNSGQPRTLAGNLIFFLLGAMLALPKEPPLRLPAFAQGALIVGFVGIAWWLQNLAPASAIASINGRISLILWDGHFLPPFGWLAVCAAAIGVLVLWVVPALPGLPSWGSYAVRPLRWCGFYTYGIYVVHALLGKLNADWIGLGPGFALLIWYSLAVISAPISYRWIEAPFLRLKTR